MSKGYLKTIEKSIYIYINLYIYIYNYIHDKLIILLCGPRYCIVILCIGSFVGWSTPALFRATTPIGRMIASIIDNYVYD